MTANYTIQGIADFINAITEDQSPSLHGIPATTSTEDGDREIPSITVTDAGSTEHEVLRGVLDPLTVEVKLWTIPNESSEDGTTQEDHEQISKELYNMLGGWRLIEYLGDKADVKVFDINNIELANERDDGFNVMTMTMDVVCCQKNQII